MVLQLSTLLVQKTFNFPISIFSHNVTSSHGKAHRIRDAHKTKQEIEENN